MDNGITPDLGAIDDMLDAMRYANYGPHVRFKMKEHDFMDAMTYAMKTLNEPVITVDTQLMTGKEKKMRTFYKVYLINKKEETILKELNIFAETSSDACLKAAQELAPTYDDRTYFIYAEDICSWEGVKE